MSENREKISFTSAAEDGERTMEIVLQNISSSTYTFFNQSMPNHGGKCSENQQEFQTALPFTANLLSRSIRQANEAAHLNQQIVQNPG